MDPIKRHQRIRKYIIEMDRALHMQDSRYVEGKFEVRGEYVLVFTDETYIHQTHAPLTSWLDSSGFVSKPTKGKRLIVLNAMTTDNFLVTRDAQGYPITEESMGKGAGAMKAVPTAEWIWEAKGKVEDYHDNMDGEGFERWLEYRLMPAFAALYPGKKMILVMDNASYHHQINVNFYPKGKTPHTSSKGLNARVLRMAGCKAIKVTRGSVDYNYEVPDAEPPDWTAFLDGRAAPGTKPPTGGADGTVYARGGSGGPAARELAIAAAQWFRAHRPEVLESKVETMFREFGWKIIWTPPYAPKYPPIELVWGVGKQRAGTMHTKGRTLLETRTHLRWGWYGGGTKTQKIAPFNARGVGKQH
jgi:transposase